MLSIILMYILSWESVHLEASMLAITDEAKEKIVQLMQARTEQNLAVGLKIVGRRSQHFEYEFGFMFEDDKRPGDIGLDMGDFQVYIDAESAPLLEGAVVSFVEVGGGSFKIDNPNPVWEDPVAQSVAEVIEQQINPGVAAHGGFVTLVKVEDSIAYIKMGGGCQGCGLAPLTLNQGIITTICEAVPVIQNVVDITQHAAGVNPYYRNAAGGDSPLG